VLDEAVFADGFETAACSGPACTAICGNGIIEAGEECERLQGCSANAYCGAVCACESIAVPLATSQNLIAGALASGSIDYPTSLLYRVWALFQDPRLPAEYDGVGAAEEDQELLHELSHMRGFLPAAIEVEITPYLLRPDDPASIFSQAPATLVARGAALQDGEPPPVGCPNNAQGKPDWLYFETHQFVVWSCGGGVDGTDPDSAKRLVVGAIAEDAYQRMQPKLGTLKPDDWPKEGPAPQTKTDIYILTLNQCRERNGSCHPIKLGWGGGELMAPPCDRSGKGPLTSSGYLIVPSDEVPASVPEPNYPDTFRANMVHEIFHLYQDTLNIEAIGGTCTPEGNPTGATTSWLVESGAAWAPFAFDPDDAPEMRWSWYESFQQRDPGTHGLQALDKEYVAESGKKAKATISYAAFIYHTFVQQEKGGKPQFLFDFWLGNQSARSALQLDRRLDAEFPFDEHFRDFAVRNVNRAGKGVTPLYESIDFYLAEGLPPNSLKYTAELRGPLEKEWFVDIAPLSAWHDSWKLGPEVRWARFDISELSGYEHARIDVLANVRGTWQRRQVTGPLFEFCRDDADDDISELYFVLSNHAFERPDETVSGFYETETKLICPKGWSGYIRLKMKLSRNSYQDFGGGSWSEENRIVREEQTWTVADTTDFEGAEQLATDWVARRTVYGNNSSSDGECETYSTEEGYGNGSDPTDFIASPNGDGSFTLTPFKLEAGSFDVKTIWSSSPCNAPDSVVTDTAPFYESLSLLSAVQGLAPLTPSPDDPTRFQGKEKVLHQETELPGGWEILDIEVDWSLKRRP
jgi:hypothetical protein